MDELAKREDNILSCIENLREDINAIQQNRTNFQIENFVVGQHFTPQRQKMQCITELRTRLFNIRGYQLDAEKLNVEIEQSCQGGDRMDSFEDRLCHVEIEKKKLQLAQIELERLSQVREAECLYAIAQSLPHYSYEEYQEAEDLYWKLRLNEQLELSNIGDRGNLQAIKQINRGILVNGLEPEKILDGMRTLVANNLIEDKEEPVAPVWSGSGKKKGK